MNKEQIIEVAKNAIDTEIVGVSKLKNSIGDDFINAVNLLHTVKGRIIVCGIGKSGHIARKISATFASTGSPAFFVHPTEAIHGDLGMISKEDVVIAISNSGNTLELAGIIGYCTRFSIPIIAITSNRDSDLGRASTICLELPKALEACGIGLAPTTSTTMSLVIGDALAVCLIEFRGFSASDFKVFHPGGLLGARLKNIGSVMHKGSAIPIVISGTSLLDSTLEMTSKRLGCVGVIDVSGNLIGIFTDGDLRRHLDNLNLNSPIDDIMTKKFITTDENKLASDVMRIMNEKQITNIFVIQGTKPVGIVHVHDLLSAGVV